MDGTKLAVYVDMIGKANFVNYFQQYADFSLSNQVVAQYISDDLPCTYKSALGRRVGPARTIIRAGRARDAMLLISRSQGLSGHVRQAAAEIAGSLSESR